MVLVAWRHQESDDMLTDEMNELMSLFGRHHMVYEYEGNRERDGTAYVAEKIRSWRHTFGVEWLPRVFAQALLVRDYYRRLDQQDGRRTTLVFTGFSSGGYWAQLAALHLATYDESQSQWHVIPTIVYAANGIEDMVTEFHPSSFPIINSSPSTVASTVIERTRDGHLSSDIDGTAERAPTPVRAIINLVHAHDSTPGMDCQLGIVCMWSYTDIKLYQKRVDGPSSAERSVYDQEIHTAHIYGQHPGFGQVHQVSSTAPQPVPEMIRLWHSRNIDIGYQPQCYDGHQYSSWYGTCRRETLRWQQRMVAHDDAKPKPSPYHQPSVAVEL
jgi:hypothetical protein